MIQIDYTSASLTSPPYLINKVVVNVHNGKLTIKMLGIKTIVTGMWNISQGFGQIIGWITISLNLNYDYATTFFHCYMAKSPTSMYLVISLVDKLSICDKGRGPSCGPMEFHITNTHLTVWL